MSIFSKIGSAVKKGWNTIEKASDKLVHKIGGDKLQSQVKKGGLTAAVAGLKVGVPVGLAVGGAVVAIPALLGGAGAAAAGAGGAAGVALPGASSVAGVGGVSKLMTTTKTITNATKTLSTNPQMDITSLVKTASTVYSGLNLSQATVSGGAVSVPTGQAGSGIFSSLVNAASGLLGKLPVSVQPPVAAAVGGAIPLASGGGIVLSVPPLNKGSVSVKTSEPMPAQSDNSFITIALFAGLGFFILKKLL